MRRERVEAARRATEVVVAVGAHAEVDRDLEGLVRPAREQLG